MSGARNLSWIESTTSLVLIGFALWTLLCHATGFLFAGGFSDLKPLAALVPFAAYLIHRALSAFPEGAVDTPAAASPATSVERDWNGLIIAMLLVAVYEFSDAYFHKGRLYLFWGLALLFLLHAWLRLAPGMAEPPPTPRESDGHGETVLFLLIILAVVLITLFVHRPDEDDQTYLNWASMTLDHPGRTLLSWNGQLWPDGLPMRVAVYRLHTFELLQALAASLTGLEPIVVSHLLFAPAFAGLALLAQARLLRHWMPGQWLAGVVILVFLLLGLGGETRAGPGIFAFVQMQFGKTVLFAFVVPLLILFGNRFAATGGWRDWLLLFFGQVAAVGFSSSGLFVALVASGLGLAAGWRPGWPATRRLLIGLSASVYLIGAGLMLKGSVQETMTLLTGFSVHNDFEKVFGLGPHLWFYLLAMIASWTLVTDPGLRRLFLGLSLLAVGFILNPFLHPIYHAYLTGKVNMWRLYLAIPLPAMGAVFLLSLFAAWRQRAWRPPSAWWLFLAVLGLFVLSFHPQWRGFWATPFALACSALFLFSAYHAAPRWRGITAGVAVVATLAALLHYDAYRTSRHPTYLGGRSTIHWPGLKVDERYFPAARRVVALAPGGKSALVPVGVNLWTPPLRHSPGLINSQHVHLQQMQRALEPDAVERRMALYDYVSGIRRPEQGPRLLEASIGFYTIGLVAAPLDNPWLEEIGQALSGAGFRRSTHDGHAFWVAG